MLKQERGRLNAPECETAKRRGKSPRFLRFVEEYRKTGNAYQAALAAGYSPKMAKGRSYELARMARAELKKAVPPVYARSIVLAHLRKRCMGLAIFID